MGHSGKETATWKRYKFEFRHRLNTKDKFNILSDEIIFISL